MKRITFAIFVMCMFSFSFAQNIYTKDGIMLGERSELIQSCKDGIEDEYIEQDGVNISTSAICICLIDEIFTSLTKEQLLELVNADGEDEDDLMTVMVMSHFTKLMDCLAGQAEFSDGFYTEKLKKDVRNTVIEYCASAILDDENIEDLEFTEKQAYGFCTCAVDKMLDEGYTYEQIMQADDEDGPVFNEVLLGCIGELGDFAELLNTSTYNPADIHGTSNSTQVTLVQYGVQGHKVKLSICGVEKYFLFDTGASDLIINTDIERQLIERGLLSEDNYLGETEYVLADGTSVVGQLVVLNNIKIGDYSVDNVTVSIIEGGSLLCGHSLLNKFKKWELKGSNTLILYR